MRFQRSAFPAIVQALSRKSAEADCFLDGLPGRFALDLGSVRQVLDRAVDRLPPQREVDARAYAFAGEMSIYHPLNAVPIGAANGQVLEDVVDGRLPARPGPIRHPPAKRANAAIVVGVGGLSRP